MAVYLTCLLNELRSAFPEDDYVLSSHSRPAYATAALTGRPAVGRGCDVVWVPAPAPVGVAPGVPFVLTVHDLSFEHARSDYTAYERLWHRVARPRALARAAARVIAVSETVRRQLLDEWGLAADRVLTIVSGPGRPVAREAQRVPDLPEHYLLAVGALEPRKRPELLLAAHTEARRQGLEAELVLAGEGRLAATSGATLLGRVSDEQLDALYKHALALVCPSRDEGFGFTPLEALARGTPAVVSDLPVFRETLGDAALYVPPDDPSALAAAFLQLEREPGMGARLVEAAAAPLNRLSWRRAAEQTRAVLAEVAE